MAGKSADADKLTPPTTLIIGCGALAREILHLIEVNGWRHMALTCLPAVLHNHPDRIAPQLAAKIAEMRPHYDRILVAYADCGSGGDIDRVCEAAGVPRIAGPHCYQFFAGSAAFTDMAERVPGTFYLTDFLARHFETLIVEGMGLDRHPELLAMFFGNYERLVYLVQEEDPELDARAESAAARLGLAYERVLTGYGELDDFLRNPPEGEDVDGETADRLLARYSGAGDREGGSEDGETGAAGALREGDRSGGHARPGPLHRRLSRRVAAQRPGRRRRRS